MPVLSNILIEATGNQLRLAATNREIGINCWIGAKVEDEGAITVPARLLAEFVNSLPAERIDMDLAEATQRLELKCARYKAHMSGIDWHEFPLLPSIATDTPTIQLDATTLATMINGVVVAASDDENRPTLKGVEVTIGKGQITMAATDGYRLGYRRQTVGIDDDATTVIVPHEALESLSKFITDAAGTIDMVVTEKRDMLLFSWTGNEKARYQRAEMSCQLIDARFPDWHATVPKEAKTIAVVPVADLQGALKTAMSFARDGGANLVRFAFAPGDVDNGSLTISATSTEMGETTTALACAVDGAAIDIAFSGKYVQDALATINDKMAVIELTQPTTTGRVLWWYDA
jgi:DNA polymerase-3 subunit beta